VVGWSKFRDFLRLGILSIIFVSSSLDMVRKIYVFFKKKKNYVTLKNYN
jgi:hypothetical protein